MSEVTPYIDTVDELIRTQEGRSKKAIIYVTGPIKTRIRNASGRSYSRTDLIRLIDALEKKITESTIETLEILGVDVLKFLNTISESMRDQLADQISNELNPTEAESSTTLAIIETERDHLKMQLENVGTKLLEAHAKIEDLERAFGTRDEVVQNVSMDSLTNQINKLEEEKSELSEQVSQFFTKVHGMEVDLAKTRTLLKGNQEKAEKWEKAYFESRDELKSIEMMFFKNQALYQDVTEKAEKYEGELIQIKDVLKETESSSQKWEQAYQNCQEQLTLVKDRFQETPPSVASEEQILQVQELLSEGVGGKDWSDEEKELMLSFFKSKDAEEKELQSLVERILIKHSKTKKNVNKKTIINEIERKSKRIFDENEKEELINYIEVFVKEKGWKETAAKIVFK